LSAVSHFQRALPKGTFKRALALALGLAVGVQRVHPSLLQAVQEGAATGVAAAGGKGKGKAAKAKPAPQPGRWLDRDCNAALHMQRIGESRWRPLELCWWPEQGKMPAKGKEYPGLDYKRLPRGKDQDGGRVVLVDEHRTSRVSSAVNGKQPCEVELNTLSATRPAGWRPPAGQVGPRLVRPAWSQERGQPVRGLMWCPVVAPRKPPQAPRSSQAATQPAASEPGPSTPLPAKRSKRTKAEPAAEPNKGKGKAAKAKPAPQPGRWLDRDCNAALNMQRIGESRWRPLELCFWPEQGALPAKGKEYPGLGYKRLRDKPPKAQEQQEQPAEAPYLGSAAVRTRRRGSAHGVSVPAHTQDEELTEQAEDDVDDELGDTVMVVACAGPHLGAAILDRLTNEFLQLVKLQAQPSVIYVSSQASQELVQALRLPTSGDGIMPAGGPGSAGAAHSPGKACPSSCPVRMERAAAFHYDKALKRLEMLRVAGQPECAMPRDHIALLNTLVDLSQEQQLLLLDAAGMRQVSALGALLLIMQKEQSRALDQQDSSFSPGITLHSLTELRLSGCLVLDPCTLSALQIFHKERHASQMGLGQPKEGFSLFTLLQRCVTQMGRRLLRTWFLRPVVNLDVITDRQDAVELMVAEPHTATRLRSLLKKVADVPKLLRQLQQGGVRPDARAFAQLRDSLAQLLSLRQAVAELVEAGTTSARTRPGAVHAGGSGQAGVGQAGVSHAVPEQQASQGSASWSTAGIGHKVLAHIGEELATAHRLLCSVLDPSVGQGGQAAGHVEQSEAQPTSGVVAVGVCEELDQLRDTYHGLPDFLTQVVEGELARVPPHIARRHSANQQLWSITYLPQVQRRLRVAAAAQLRIGYAIQVTGQALAEELLEYLEDYERAFEGHCEQGYAIYYRTNSTQELSRRFGDMLYKIQDLEASLCAELVRRLAAHGPALHRAAGVAAELDCLASFAQAASQLSYCRPELTLDSVLAIEGGRHPLTELVVERGPFIPNTTTMGLEHGRVHVITGTSFVPATRAVVGVMDRIFTRVVSQERLALGQSTFMIDLTQVSRMLNRATGNSLVIIDEFGKVRCPLLPIAGLVAPYKKPCLSHFCEMPQPPRVLACTHFQELTQEEVLARHPQLSFFTMDIMTQTQQQQAHQQPQPQFATSQLPQAGSGPGNQPSSAQQAPGNILFLYSLVPGVSAPSFGINCAQMCGVKADVVRRAQEILEAHSTGRPGSPLKASQQQVQPQPQYQQRYKLVNDRLPKERQRLHRAVEYRRGIDGRARNNV
ncbi:hypothetical protein QJQ45_026904, partial [Haematococcus lacustris]